MGNNESELQPSFSNDGNPSFQSCSHYSIEKKTFLQKTRKLHTCKYKVNNNIHRSIRITNSSSNNSNTSNNETTTTTTTTKATSKASESQQQHPTKTRSSTKALESPIAAIKTATTQTITPKINSKTSTKPSESATATTALAHQQQKSAA
ncbi:hypothetical protein PoB_001383500 [Plakobranchus ocellatus]|uniref:Uncharacterized protein n=1 Tax=Plakobranchus ocellatus TaxID=259542 RepID=A0AAV3YWQ9_9GAST|nr:hypothetical protein PoB_001383500 [Plakobranchus ocellatus]